MKSNFLYIPEMYNLVIDVNKDTPIYIEESSGHDSYHEKTKYFLHYGSHNFEIPLGIVEDVKYRIDMFFFNPINWLEFIWIYQ